MLLPNTLLHPQLYNQSARELAEERDVERMIFDEIRADYVRGKREGKVWFDSASVPDLGDQPLAGVMFWFECENQPEDPPPEKGRDVRVITIAE